MTRRRSRIASHLLAASIGLATVAPSAFAGLVGTDCVVATSQAANDRARVKALLARSQVAAQLRQLGVAPEEVQARVDSLTDQEVHPLAARIDSMPAGGNFTEFQWVMIVIGAVIIALLV